MVCFEITAVSSSRAWCSSLRDCFVIALDTEGEFLERALRDNLWEMPALHAWVIELYLTKQIQHSVTWHFDSSSTLCSYTCTQCTQSKHCVWFKSSLFQRQDVARKKLKSFREVTKTRTNKLHQVQLITYLDNVKYWRMAFKVSHCSCLDIHIYSPWGWNVTIYFTELKKDKSGV